jgi:plasmid stabilization system protein ParE
MTMKKIKWTDEAQRDLRAIWSFIARDSVHNADRFIGKLVRAARRLRRFPSIGTIVADLTSREYREVLHGNFRIVYRLKDDQVLIVAVRHAARLLDDSMLPPTA